MGVERSQIGLHKSLRQRGKALAGAIPGEFVGRVRNRGAKFLLKAAAHQRVQPVGGDDQVVSPEFVQRLDRGVVPRVDACRAHALLQDGQEFEPADRGEADAVDLDALPMQIERDVLPALHPRRDGVDRLGIVGAQKFQRLFGEHHAKPPGRAFGVLFEQVDMRVRMTPLPEIGEVEAAGASADDGDTHVFLPIDSILTNLEPETNPRRKFALQKNDQGTRLRRPARPRQDRAPISPAGSVRERLSALRQPGVAGPSMENAAGSGAAANLHAVDQTVLQTLTGLRTTTAPRGPAQPARTTPSAQTTAWAVARLEGHGGAKGEQGGCNDQKGTHAGLPDYDWLMFRLESFF